MRTAWLIVLAVFSGAGMAQDKPAEEKSPAREVKASEPQITVKGAKTEQETKARLRADALLARCVIKPVMTDEEIDLCKRAYRDTR